MTPPARADGADGAGGAGRADGAALVLGLDFGTESVRALVVALDGHVVATGEAPYPHGQIVAGRDAAARLFPAPLAGTTALQHPGDWLPAAAQAVRAAADAAGDPTLRDRVRGIGIDATSCTILPALRDGTPLATSGRVDPHRPHAWPKLWKHHGASAQADRLTRLAGEREEPWLSRYGHTVGLEWFLPKVLEVIDDDPDVADAAEVWIELGDWLVWQLTGERTAGGALAPEDIVRSTCQAGYKACWSPEAGYPSADYCATADPRLADAVATRLPGRHAPPGACAGPLSPAGAAVLGLSPGTAVSVATIDAHAGVAGSGVVGPGELVLVLGTSGCHMVMAEHDVRVPGVAGVVADGILPGWFGYETGQAAVGDAFDWVRRLCGHSDHDALTEAARGVPAGADGLLVLDWFNGCRTPLMDGERTGAILGARLHHGPEHLYRATLEASAAGLRWIVDTLVDGGVPIHRVVATGGLPRRNHLLVEIVAAMLDAPVEVNAVDHGPAFGAAILGAVAAGCFDDAAAAATEMAGPGSAVPPRTVVTPDPALAERSRALSARYRAAASALADLDLTPLPKEPSP